MWGDRIAGRFNASVSRKWNQLNVSSISLTVAFKNKRPE